MYIVVMYTKFQEIFPYIVNYCVTKTKATRLKNKMKRIPITKIKEQFELRKNELEKYHFDIIKFYPSNKKKEELGR